MTAQLAAAVARAIEDSEDFPAGVHAPTADAHVGGSHVLVTIEPAGMWAAMPGAAVRAAIAQHLTRHARALRAAGYGVESCEHRGATAALIVAATPAAAVAQAPAVRAHLAALNPQCCRDRRPIPPKNTTGGT